MPKSSAKACARTSSPAKASVNADEYWMSRPVEIPSEDPACRRASAALPNNASIKPNSAEYVAAVSFSSARKPGRPRIVENWFEQLATAMADGTSLRVALRRLGLPSIR